MARKRLASEGASSPSIQNSRPSSEADSPSSLGSANANIFDWTAFTEEELHQSPSRTPQATQNDSSRPVSSTPSRSSRSHRLSGATLVPSIQSSTRSTLIATPSPAPHVSRSAPPRHQHASITPPPPAPSPPHALLATTPPADTRAFLDLARAIKRAHASSFFVLVPLRRRPPVANHGRARASAVRPPTGTATTAVPALLDHAVEFVSVDLAERPGVLARVLGGAVGRLGEGLRRGRTFVWEGEGRDLRVECVPVGDGREVWWVCFVR
ncbi:uncharacterized protein LTHEOB_7626 [Neofusicoccum parvum]|nr:uncharacterized protein LTHEOB_7626 [Neofusicoccum parvum]